MEFGTLGYKKFTLPKYAYLARTGNQCMKKKQYDHLGLQQILQYSVWNIQTTLITY